MIDQCVRLPVADILLGTVSRRNLILCLIFKFRITVQFIFRLLIWEGFMLLGNPIVVKLAWLYVLLTDVDTGVFLVFLLLGSLVISVAFLITLIAQTFLNLSIIRNICLFLISVINLQFLILVLLFSS